MTLQELFQVLDKLDAEEVNQVYAYLEQRRHRLHAGLIWMSDDFNEPLPDKFWLGDEA